MHQIDTVTADEWSLMHLAAFLGKKESLLWLLDKCDLPEITTGDGWTPFYVAAMAGQIEILTCLLNLGKSKRMALIRAKDGSKAMHAAAYHNQLGTCKWLSTQVPGSCSNEVSQR